MMARKLNGRSISIHRSYTVSEIAEALRVHRGTVMQWIRDGKVAPNDLSKPYLIHGTRLREFIACRTPKKQKCALHEWYCFRCSKPRSAAFDEAEIIGANAKTCNVRALCNECAAAVHKRFSLKAITPLRQIIGVTAPQPLKHLIE